MDYKQDPEYVAHLESTVANLTRLIEVSNVLNTAILSGDSRLNALLGYLMNAAALITESEAASVLLWDEDTQQLFFAATTTTSNSLIGKPVPLDSIAGTIVREKRMIEVADVKQEPRHYSKVDQDIAFVTRSLLGVPMISRDRVIGVLEVVNKEKLPWTTQDRSNLSTLAGESALAIQVAQMVNDLQQANDELSELDKLKNDFIAIASHELRTPLGIILGYASFLQEAEDESVHKHAAKVMGSALRLRRIIEDMINLRYLKQKPSDLQRDPVSLQDLLHDLQQDVMTVIDPSDRDLKINCLNKHQYVNVDRSRVVMALVNIVNNAVVFTSPQGNIEITARVANPQEAWIAVKDDGIGLKEDQLPRIFDEFYQAEDHMTRRHGGLGIGLSISRALIQAHGGRIWAESPGPDQGTTITIALPLE